MAKKENKLELMYLPYRGSYYLKHPLKFIREIYWNIRNFIHRGRYGYSYPDVWNWLFWWPTAGAEALRQLAEYGCGYPGHEPWETPEKWKAYLLDTADKLEWCVRSAEEPEGYGREEERANIFAEIGKNLGRFWD